MLPGFEEESENLPGDKECSFTADFFSETINAQQKLLTNAVAESKQELWSTFLKALTRKNLQRPWNKLMQPSGDGINENTPPNIRLNQVASQLMLYSRSNGAYERKLEIKKSSFESTLAVLDMTG